jgi:hypothetical protein
MSIFALIGGIIAANGGPVAVGVLGAQIIARAIPDDKKGPLRHVRNVAKFVGMYVNVDQRKLEAKVESNSALIAEAVQIGRVVKKQKD